MRKLLTVFAAATMLLLTGSFAWKAQALPLNGVGLTLDRSSVADSPVAEVGYYRYGYYRLRPYYDRPYGYYRPYGYGDRPSYYYRPYGFRPYYGSGHRY
jgi:hypothetical protein